MRNPITALTGNLMWTRAGVVWATWRLKALPYGWRPDEGKSEVRASHRALLRALRGEALLLGLRADICPESVVNQMIEGVPLDRCPSWVEECQATLDLLEDLDLSERTFWLSVPLRQTTTRERLLEPARAALTNFKDALGIPRGGLPDSEVTTRLRQANQLLQQLPPEFAPRPATVAEQVWIQLHAQRRGLLGLEAPTETGGGLAGDLLVHHSGAAIPEVILDEGGQSDVKSRRLNPAAHRYLKVTNPDLDQSSYQAMFALADVPMTMQFPGSEFIGALDHAHISADWAVRLHIRSREEVLARNRRAVNNLHDQMGQREHELTLGAGELDRAAGALAEYQSVLSSDDLEVEVEATTIYAVAGRTAAEVEHAAAELNRHYTSAGYRLARPIGLQRQLWSAALPGSLTTAGVRDLAQIATSHAFSAACPIISSALGDRQGSLLGLNISSNALSPVLHDIAGASTKLNASGALAACGDLGAGKSVILKKMAGDTSDRGGRWIAIDRSDEGEWAVMARSLPRSTVVDVAAPQVSLDPLRLFGTADGARTAQSFLMPLLGVKPQSDAGGVLSDVLQKDYLGTHGISSLGQLTEHLSGLTVRGADALAGPMRMFARLDIGRVIFDGSLPPLQLDDEAIVFGTRQLELPTPDELREAHLFENMRLEKVFGRALYALMTAIARRIAFADRSQLVMFVVDEAHHVTASLEGNQELIRFVRESRRALASLALGSHDPEADFGDPTLRGLIPTRILLRHRDRTLAQRGLRWLDLDPDDESLVDLICNNTSPIGPEGVLEHRRGEGLMRDTRGRIARIKVLLPARQERAAALNTTPGATSSAGQT